MDYIKWKEWFEHHPDKFFEEFLGVKISKYQKLKLRLTIFLLDKFGKWSGKYVLSQYNNR